MHQHEGRSDRATPAAQAPSTCVELVEHDHRSASSGGSESSDDADERWRLRHNLTSAAFPHLGRRRCNATEGRPQESWRAQWSASRFASIFERRQQPLTILEIGPCLMPNRFTPHLPEHIKAKVVVHTADFTNDEALLRKNCFNGKSVPHVDVVDDAQVLSNVADSSYDGLMAFHVLEHMADPIGALKAWLRVVRPGGCILFAVPDACAERQNGDRLRLPPTPEHLVSDHRFALKHKHKAAPLLSRSDRIHGTESSISQGVFILEIAAWVLANRPTELQMRQFANSAEFAKQAPCPGAPLTAQRPAHRLMSWLRTVHRNHDVHQSHFHAWDVPAMREMLETARPWLAETSAFRTIDLVSAQSGPFQMQELHVALERVGQSRVRV